MSAIILIRVSTNQQANSGLGAEAQETACRAWVKTNNLELSTVVQELGVSGGLELDKREGLLEAISQLGKGDVLVVAKRDRLSRQTLAMAMIERMVEKRGATIASADGVANEDTPEGALMRSIITSFAVYERLLAKSRTKAALKAKKAQGKRYTYNPPFGFRFVGGLIVEHAQEQDALVMAKGLREQGQTLASIGEELFVSGYTNRKGTRLGVGTIHKMLKRAA
jgi:DNA invertase Pin-like site-specific DNA recombinase